MTTELDLCRLQLSRAEAERDYIIADAKLRLNDLDEQIKNLKEAMEMFEKQGESDEAD